LLQALQDPDAYARRSAAAW